MNPRTKWAIVRFLMTTVSLMGGWILFTWSVDPGSLITGLAASLLLSYITYSIFIDEEEAGRRSHLPRLHVFIVFLAVLIFNMYVASFQVLWHII
ncbi:MAG: Na+/H+ antiporter subunit E, partial [Spirochaetaceae bacterium]|nr:Na+/H+ antiporter subunit E [Spirochaetaceae bacterium]